MSKADVLLQKATAFERLSLYSDRKTFLQRIAQDASVQQFPPAGAGGVSSPYVPGTEPPSVPPPPEGQIALQETTISGNATPAAKPMIADPYVTALQQYLSAGPWGLQKGVDGKLGPDTRGALKNWQSANGLNPTGQLDKATIDTLRPIIQKYTK